MKREKNGADARRRRVSWVATGNAPGHVPLATAPAWVRAACLAAVLTTAACGEILDAGHNMQRGELPVDGRNPIILCNDGWQDNWAGEYAVLMASRGELTLAGIVVDGSKYWTNQDENEAGWTGLVAAARTSGLDHLPDVARGAGTPLAVPADQKIESTVPLRTEGSQLILDVSRRLYLSGQPVTVVTGGPLTDLADAYLMDPTVVDRVVVVASLGSFSSPKASMTGPNGDLDPWADWIVAQRFRYIQVTVLYDQAGELTPDDFDDLPKNQLGRWMQAKYPELSTLNTATDQVAVLVAAVPGFASSAPSYAPDPTAVFNSPPGQGPPLLPSATGRAKVITQVDASLPRKRLWEMLEDPLTFAP